MYSYNPYYETYLSHHGVKGMRWGVRRYQNYDGSWKDKGRIHRGIDTKRKTLFYNDRFKKIEKSYKKENKDIYSRKELKEKAKEYAEQEMDKKYDISKVQKNLSKGASTMDKITKSLMFAAPLIAIGSVGIGLSVAKSKGILPNNASIKKEATNALKLFFSSKEEKEKRIDFLVKEAKEAKKLKDFSKAKELLIEAKTIKDAKDSGPNFDLKKIMKDTAISSLAVAGGKKAALYAEDRYYDKKENKNV